MNDNLLKTLKEGALASLDNYAILVAFDLDGIVKTFDITEEEAFEKFGKALNEYYERLKNRKDDAEMYEKILSAMRCECFALSNAFDIVDGGDKKDDSKQ